jgi:cytochrome c
MNSVIPRDIPLPLPAPAWLLELLLVVSFVGHILFVNLMVGGQTLTLVFQLMGLKDPKWDQFAHLVAKTVTVNKSIAVVLGVGPLLTLNVLYTSFIYTANILTGTAWLMLIPLISFAFILTYLHKYTWKILENHKGVHISIGGIATLLFLFIPLIFLTNINLMLFPDKWTEVNGFLSALLLPNVFTRYFHFLGASLTATSLFLIGFIGRKKEVEEVFDSYPQFKFTIRKKLYGLCFTVTIAQLIIGPLVLFTLPSRGINTLILVFLAFATLLAFYLLFLLFNEMKNPQPVVGRKYFKIILFFGGIVALMVNIRHLYREQALAESKIQQKDKSETFAFESSAAKSQINSPSAPSADSGKLLFESTCNGCHAIDKTLVGPSVFEIQKIYAGNSTGIVKWAQNPGKKRDGMAMPAMAHVPESDLILIAEWMLKAK